MKQFSRLLVLTPALAGVLLQGYIAFVMPDGHLDAWLAGLFLYSCLPYAICWVIATRSSPLAGFFGALAALIADMMTFYDVFVAPTSSTAALGLVIAPAVNLVLFMPIGLIIGWCIHRGIRACLLRGQMPPADS